MRQLLETRRLGYSLLLAMIAALAISIALGQKDTPLRPLRSLVQAPREPVSSTSPFIDVHTHLEPEDLEASVRAALAAMPGENAAKLIFMPPPFAAGDAAVYDADKILPLLRGHEDKLAVLAGGGTLNLMIHQAVRSGDAGPEIRQRFRAKADELLKAGAAGFGEITAEHFAAATPYQSAAPDHPLFLLLADIAAEHHVPIDLHMEAVPQPMPLPAELKSPPNPRQLHDNIAAFERLLKHNRGARIIWAHAGTDYSGDRTPELCRRLLAAHSNLYMEIKIDPIRPGKSSLLDDDGKIKPRWLQLLQDFPDRFMAGSDQHYPEPAGSQQRWQAVVLLLNQLPPELRQKIAYGNAANLYSGHSGPPQRASTAMP